MVDNNFDCGSGPCMNIIDRLRDALKEQHENGLISIEKLMQAHHLTIKTEIINLKTSIKAQGDEIYPRLRVVEGKVDLLRAVAIDEKRAKDLISTDERIIAWDRTRKRLDILVGTVLAGVIVSAILYVAGRLKFI